MRVSIRRPRPNGGEGFDKNLSGNQLPNTPPFTLSLGAQYSMPLSADWAATARADGYWQGNSFARVFNDRPYDQLHGYTNLNLTLIFTNQDGWQAMAYMKNVFNTTAITGAFLNSDDIGADDQRLHHRSAPVRIAHHKELVTADRQHLRAEAKKWFSAEQVVALLR